MYPSVHVISKKVERAEQDLNPPSPTYMAGTLLSRLGTNPGTDIHVCRQYSATKPRKQSNTNSVQYEGPSWCN